MQARHLHELAPDRQARVQRRRRLLVNDGDARAAYAPQLGFAHPDEVVPLQQYAPLRDGAVAAEIAHDRHQQGGFAAAGLAHKSETLARLDIEREIRDYHQPPRRGPVLDAQVLDG